MRRGIEGRVNHSGGLDFYLPPPDDRVYRRGRIQRLRDQITSWKRSGRSSSAAPVTKSGEGNWLGSCKASLDRRVMGSGLHHKKGGKTHDNKPESELGQIYYHDHIVFCVPSDKSGGKKKPFGYDNICYGVTANVGSLYGHRKDVQQTLLGQQCALNGASGANSGRFSAARDASQATSQLKQQLREAAPNPFLIAHTVKAQSIELASSVHEARMLSMRDELSGSYCLQRQAFARTTEIPIDWNEYNRFSSRFDSYASNDGFPVPKSGNRPSSAAEINFATSSNFYAGGPAASLCQEGLTSANREGSARRSTAVLHPNGRKPLRLYAIQMKGAQQKTVDDVRLGADAPRLGVHVLLKS
uniref:Uncharacterized protein n=1 Tax=Trypanosoma congolense (strain IL3000) TaxID=1068625 RepID=G0UTM5_TRYCI|nr:conserved hypothetical protein [Trypanosoma congolense IL3000]